MSTYTFKAMDMAGAPLRGQVDADSKQAVSDQLYFLGRHLSPSRVPQATAAQV